MSDIDRAEVERLLGSVDLTKDGLLASYGFAPSTYIIATHRLCHSWLEKDAALLAAREERDRTKLTTDAILSELRQDRDRMLSLQADNARLREERDKLREALAPFARQARVINESDEIEGVPTDDSVLFQLLGSYVALSVGDCRRALKALEGEET